MLDPDVLKTAIITFGSIATGVIGLIATISQINKSRARRESEVSPEDQAAEERYSADPRLFVRDVLESNKQLALEVKGYRQEVQDLRDELKEFRANDRKFRTALARWVLRIMDTFMEHNIDMPLPDEHDAAILADVIPSALEASRPRPPRMRPA